MSSHCFERKTFHSLINIFSFELPNSRLGFLNKPKKQKKAMTELGGK